MNLVERVMPCLQLGQHLLVVDGVDDHGHVLPVLGSGAQHGGAADVDVLDGVFQRAVGLGGGLGEGVQVDDQQVDGADAVLLERGHVLRQVAAGQEAAVHARVQGLDAAVQHFREAGDLRPPRSRAGLSGQQLGGAAGGQQLDALSVQGLGKFDDAGLVETRTAGR
jgi:hypothetical protein